MDVDIQNIDLDQCATGDSWFADTHKCNRTTMEVNKINNTMINGDQNVTKLLAVLFWHELNKKTGPFLVPFSFLRLLCMKCQITE